MTKAYSGPESGSKLWESVNKSMPSEATSTKKKVVKPKKSAFSTKPKKDLLGDALKDRARRYTPYKRVNSAFSK